MSENEEELTLDFEFSWEYSVTSFIGSSSTGFRAEADMNEAVIGFKGGLPSMVMF